MSERLDAYLVACGLATSREKAKESLAAGYVSVNGKTVTKPSYAVKPEDEVQCAAPAEKYVGRGGYKLEKALEGLSVEGVTALDIGASTGGFTDCLLQHGAAKVYATDVGTDQLHGRLRADARVVSLENTDARDTAKLAQTVPLGSIGMMCMDVSFISITAVLEGLIPFLTADAHIVCLIKPQFEAGRAAVGKNGVVKDKKAHERVLNTLCAYFVSLGLTVRRLIPSPIRGRMGNIEYLAVLSNKEGENVFDPLQAVEQAFSARLL